MPKQLDRAPGRRASILMLLCMLTSTVDAQQTSEIPKSAGEVAARIVRALENPVPLYSDAEGERQVAEEAIDKGESWQILEFNGDYARVELNGVSYWVDTGDVVLDRKVKARCAPSPSTVVVAGQMGAGNEECNE